MKFSAAVCLYVAAIVGLGPCSEGGVRYREAEELHCGNAILRTVPGTLHALPWAAGAGKYHIGEVLCEAYWQPPYRAGAHMGACTRHLARAQLQRLSTLGYRFLSGHEAEFFMYRKDGQVILSIAVFKDGSQLK